MKRLTTTLGILIGLLCSLVLTTHCENPLLCTGDRDCIRKFGADFLCVKAKCQVDTKGESTAEEPTVDAAPDVAPDEPAPPEPRPEPTPEPVIEITAPDDPPVEKVPDVPPVVRKKLLEPCKDYEHAPETEKCDLGLICVRLDGKTAFCFQDCSANTAVCKVNQDRNECATVAWDRSNPAKPIRICTQTRQKGESCDPKQGHYCSTTTNPSLVCFEGRCETGKLCANVGCPCESRPNAPATCDAAQKLICDPSSNTCITGVRALEGQPCGLFNNIRGLCDTGFICTCTPGSVCTGTGRPPTTCHKLCDLSNPLTSCIHQPGFACKKYLTNDDQTGVCIQEGCTSQHDCNHQSYAHHCQGKTTGTRVDRWCEPLPPPGTADYGQSCDATFATGSTCKHPYQCAFIRQKTINGRPVLSGFCNIECDKTKPGIGEDLCEKSGKGSTCTLVNNNSKVQSCGWNCANGKACPTDYECERDICVPK